MSARLHSLILSVGTVTLLAGPANAQVDRTDVHGDPLPPGVAARMGTVRLRHRGYVRCVAFSPDGCVLAVGSKELVCLWDTATGKLARTLAHTGDVLEVAYSADGKLLATSELGFPHRNVRIWETTTGKELHCWGQTNQVAYFLALAPDGQWVVTSGSNDSTIVVREAATGKEVRKLAGHTKYLWSFVLSGNGKILASTSSDLTLRVWDVASGKELHKFQGGNYGFESMQLSEDGQTLRATDRTSTYVWEVASGKQLNQYRREAAAPAALSPDGAILAVMPGNSAVALHETASGKKLRDLTVVPPLANYSYGASVVAFSPDGRLLARKTHHCNVLLWEVASGKQLHLFDAPPTPVQRAALTPDGKQLISQHEGETVLRRWQVADGKPLAALPVQGVPPWALSPDGKTLAVASAKEPLRLLDALTGREIVRHPAENSGHCASLAFSPDGRRLAGGRHDGSISVWEAVGKPVRNFQAYPLVIDEDGGRYAEPVAFLKFGPDGQFLVFGSKNGHKTVLCDAATGREFRQVPGSHTRAFRDPALALSPDGKLLATTGRTNDKAIGLWETASGKQRLRFGAEHAPANKMGEYVCLAFAADGRTLASGGGDAVVRLWDTATGKELRQLRGHLDAITFVAFLPSGKGLVSGSMDSTLLVWEDTAPVRASAVREATAAELEARWQALADPDAAKAHAVIHALASDPGAAVPFLRERLRPVPAADTQVLKNLIDDLDNAEFARRQQATEGLEELGELARADLEKVLAANPALEVQRRVEALLARLAERTMSAEAMRTWRAIEVLERIGTPEAGQALAKLAEGAAGAAVTRDARRALGRGAGQ